MQEGTENSTVLGQEEGKTTVEAVQTPGNAPARNDRKWMGYVGLVGLILFLLGGVMSVIPVLGAIITFLLAPLWFICMIIGFFGPNKIWSLITAILMVAGIVVIAFANFA